MTKEEAIKITRHVFAYYDRNSNEISWEDRNEAYGVIVKALDQEPKTGHWIPVSERLPEECKGVLVYCPTDNNIFCAYMERGEWKIFSPIAKEKINEVVSVWMPLSELYEPVESEEKK